MLCDLCPPSFRTQSPIGNNFASLPTQVAVISGPFVDNCLCVETQGGVALSSPIVYELQVCLRCSCKSSCNSSAVTGLLQPANDEPRSDHCAAICACQRRSASHQRRPARRHSANDRRRGFVRRARDQVSAQRQSARHCSATQLPQPAAAVEQRSDLGVRPAASLRRWLGLLWQRHLLR